MCVALTRARNGLFVFGNASLLAAMSKLWRGALGDLEKRNALGGALALRPGFVYGSMDEALRLWKAPSVVGAPLEAIFSAGPVRGRHVPWSRPDDPAGHGVAGPAARAHGQRLRASSQAIMVGSGTALGLAKADRKSWELGEVTAHSFDGQAVPVAPAPLLKLHTFTAPRQPQPRRTAAAPAQAARPTAPLLARRPGQNLGPAYQ